MRLFSKSALALVIVAGGMMLSLGASAPRPELVVHEWGVMIRRTNTQLAPPDELLASLPGFVLRHDEHYKPVVNNPYGNGIQVWTKPVIHFYGREGQDVDVTIRTPKGRPLVYWPEPIILTAEQPQQLQINGRFRGWDYGQYTPPQQAQGLKWSGALTTKKPQNLPKVRDDDWWNTARDVPSMYVKTDKGSERFIFYEGTAESQPSVTAVFSPDDVTLTNSSQHDSGPVVLIVADRDVHCAHAVNNVPGRKSLRLSKSAVCANAIERDELLTMCREQWMAHGMSADEAIAIVDIWAEDLLRPVGCLLITRVPSDVYDTIFPLEMNPKPTELVRVGMVFDLVDDQPNRIDWLPRTQRHLQQQATKLDSEDYHTREAAFDDIAAHVDLGESVLKQLVGHRDPEVDWRAKALLHRIALDRQKQPIPNQTPVETGWLPQGVMVDGPVIHRLQVIDE